MGRLVGHGHSLHSTNKAVVSLAEAAPTWIGDSDPFFRGSGAGEMVAGEETGCMDTSESQAVMC